MKNLVVVYNSKSGGSFTKAKLEHRFEAAGLEPVAFIPTDKKLGRRLNAYITSKATIAVVGGDGTMSLLADMLAGTGATLAPLPGGTLNHFAIDLGIPHDMDEALKRLPEARRHKIDIASVNNVTFINNSSIGLYPASLQTRRRLEDYFGKWPAAIIGGLRALIRFRVYQLKIDNQPLASPFVFVGNNRYDVDKFGTPTRGRLTQGVLSVHVARASSRWRLFIIFLHALSGRARVAEGLQSFTVRDRLVIEGTTKNIRVSHDGESELLSSHLTYKIHPKSLWVR